MSDVWLRGNQRVLLGALTAAVVVAAAGSLVYFLASGQVLRIIGAVLTCLGGLATVWSAWMMRRPRLACTGSELLVYALDYKPFRVPLDMIECFFLGRAGTDGQCVEHSRVTTSTVVVRLAERAGPWAERSLPPPLGNWHDGYITLFGTWCEPLSLDRVNELNERLRLNQRQLRAQQAQA